VRNPPLSWLHPSRKLRFVGLGARIPWEGPHSRASAQAAAEELSLRRGAILSSLASRLLVVVEEAAAGFDAVVTQAGPTVTLEPPRPGEAALLGFSIDAPEQVSCFPGEHGMCFELWRADFEDMLAATVELAAAVLDGTYTERVQAARGPRGPRIVASWPDAVGARRTSGLNAFLGILNDENSILSHYPPYRRTT
jgi:hypothetical protein